MLGGDYDAGAADGLYNREVRSFDFLGMVDAFGRARKESPGFTSWDVTNALLQFHLSGADDFALGGDLAYWLREAELRGRKSRALLNGPPGLLFAHALKRAGK